MSDHENGALVPMDIMATGSEIAFPGSMTPARKIADAIESVQSIKRFTKVVRDAALSSTRASDWRDWNGKLRPEVSGASAIANMFGVKISPAEVWEEPTNNGYVVWSKAKFYLPLTGVELEARGSCRSDDDFVATRYDYNQQTRQREKKQLPPEEVDKTNVTKAAIAQMTVNGIMRMFGLGNVSREELAAAGIVLQESQSVRHSKGSWEINDNQTNYLKSLMATPAEIDSCKSNADVSALITRLKGEKRQKKAEPQDSAPKDTKPQGDGVSIVDRLFEMGEAIGYSLEMINSKVDEARKKSPDGLRDLYAAWSEICKAKK